MDREKVTIVKDERYERSNRRRCFFPEDVNLKCSTVMRFWMALQPPAGGHLFPAVSPRTTWLGCVRCLVGKLTRSFTIGGLCHPSVAFGKRLVTNIRPDRLDNNAAGVIQPVQSSPQPQFTRRPVILPILSYFLGFIVYVYVCLCILFARFHSK